MSLKFIDLFAGCGGLSLGLEQAGFIPVYVNELNKDALETYLINRESEFPHLRDQKFHSANIKDCINPKFFKNLKSNFKFPYFSRNIAEFWRKWHISLSSWFRDYLYIPLGGSRVSKIKSIRNIFIIFKIFIEEMV